MAAQISTTVRKIKSDPAAPARRRRRAAAHQGEYSLSAKIAR
jgi:hypothetical protein